MLQEGSLRPARPPPVICGGVCVAPAEVFPSILLVEAFLRRVPGTAGMFLTCLWGLSPRLSSILFLGIVLRQLCGHFLGDQWPSQVSVVRLDLGIGIRGSGC